MTIQAYAWPPSVAPGGALELHVSTDAPWFGVELYRQHDRLLPVASSGWFPGHDVAGKDAATDWEWPAVSLAIGTDWPSGVYLAVLRTAQAPGAPHPAAEVTTTEGSDRALFVVLGGVHTTARILYKIPLFTYHAYNHAGGGNLYRDELHAASPRGCKVTMKRSGGGITTTAPGDPVPDAYDPQSPRQVFAHWDAPFIAWLARQKLAVDYCTDLDVHEHPALLPRYRLILSVGHDEYWTQDMRDNLTAFVERGGNLALFSGNVCWWRITLTDGATAIVCDKQLPDQWWRRAPENALTGVSYRNGGGWWTGEREPTGYTITDSRSWVFAGTGLADGDVVGAAARLVGYECDGAAVDARGSPTHADGTPPSFVVVALARLSERWEDCMAERPVATMGLHNRTGIVFTAATTDWARVLSADPAVARITHNVVDRLSRRSAGRSTIGALDGVRAISGAPGGRRAVVATGDAAIGQLAWPSGQPLRCERLARIEPPGAVAIYPVAGAGHVVVAAMSGGDLVAWTLQPGHAAGQRVIARLDHPAGILAGCVASDGAHHLVVGDHRGAVLELAWRPGDRATRRELARFDAAIAGAAIHAEGTALHAAIATRDGAIIELSWQGRRVHRAVRARSGRPITSIAAYHAAVDDPGHGRPGETARGTYAVVATDDGNLRALWWATGDDGARHDVLPHVGAIAALDAFHGHDDTHRVLIATPTGELHELHWRVADAAGRVQD